MSQNTVQKIVNCEFIFKCPQSWEKMDKTDVDGVRYCDECRRDVHFVETDEDLHRLSNAGECVAVFTETNSISEVNLKPIQQFDTSRRFEVTAGIPAPPERNVTAGIPAASPVSDLPKCFECNGFFPAEGKYCPKCGAARDGSRGALAKNFSEISYQTLEPIEEKSWLQKLASFFGIGK